MRLLPTLVVLLAAIYLHLGAGVQTDTKDDKNIFVYNNGATPNTEAYVKLLEELRSRLASGSKAHQIAVTRSPTNVLLQERFVQVQLENNGGDVITVIIDTVNVYVVGYLVDQTLHYLDDIPREELFQAFPMANTQYTHSRLGFAGNYDSLPDRESHELGHGALNVAIGNLYYGQSQPSALLVIIQMVAEAVRIKYIEHRIRQNMIMINLTGENLNFIPDPRAISIENRWSDLSEQIQWSGGSGVFLRPILVRSVLNEDVQITSVLGVMRQAALALIVYRCNPNAIRMPVPVAVGADEQCPYGEPTTNIIGRDEQCMDVKDNQYNNGNPIILWPCGNAKRNQLWTFKSDGTIRSNGKCLTTDGYTEADNITIFDCDTAVPEATQWILYDDGTIMNPKSGLVIGAWGYVNVPTQGTVQFVFSNYNSSYQAWTAGNYTQPTINYISGLREICIQAYRVREYSRVLLGKCVIGNGTEPKQQLALYSDGTIRLYSDPTLCLTAYPRPAGELNILLDNMDIIILQICKGFWDQRWTFMADGTILNPRSQLVLDAGRGSSFGSLQELVLYEPTGKPSQTWLVL